MLIYLVAILQALIYLASVPVCAAFCLSIGDEVRVGVGVGAFERRFALRRALRFNAFPLRAPKRRGEVRIWRLLAKMRGLELGLHGHLGLGDAAVTALACGTLQALAAALSGRERRAVVDIRPVFSSSRPEAELQGMIRARAGQIITAAVKSGIDDIHRRIDAWKSIPLKAS